MSSITIKLYLCFCLVLLSCLISNNVYAVGKTTKVSINSNGVESNSSGILGNSISANGRFIAFESLGINLDGISKNNFRDIYVHDRLTHKTKRVSVNSSGVEGNNSSRDPRISADGRFVTFYSYASNLVDGDTNKSWDVFVHDRMTAKTTRVSVSSNGTQGNQSSMFPSISADGRFIAFASNAYNLVPGDTNGHDFFVHDRLTKQTERVSVASDGTQGNNFDGLYGYQLITSISSDGRYVAFDSSASNLVPSDTNNVNDIFVHDRQTHQTTRVSVNSSDIQGDNTSLFPNLSADGRIITFTSAATNLIPNDAKNQDGVFLHNRLTHQTSKIPIPGHFSSLSADGRYVSFRQNEYVPATDTLLSNVQVYDNLTHTNTPIWFDKLGNPLSCPALIIDIQFMDFSEGPYGISADGRNVAFHCGATFVRDRLFSSINSTDVQITTTSKPASVVINNQASYDFTVTNMGSFATQANLIHLISNGDVINFTPSQGICRKYAAISLCNFGLLSPGQSLTLGIAVKSLRNSLTQQLTLSRSGNDDPNQANNYLYLMTPVTQQ